MASETTESRTARDWRQIRWLAVACIIVAALAIYRQRPVRIGSVADFELVGTDVSIVETRGADGGLESLATGDELVLLRLPFRVRVVRA